MKLTLPPQNKAQVKTFRIGKAVPAAKPAPQIDPEDLPPVLVMNAAYDELYVNYEKTPRMCRLLASATSDHPSPRIMVFNEYEKGWFEVAVPAHYALQPLCTNALTRLTPARRPKPDQEDPVKHKSSARTNNLPIRRARALPPPAPHDGKKVFLATLGTTKGLCDAGDGVFIQLADMSPTEYATMHKLTIVKRSAATSFAAKVYEAAWAEARKAKKS